MKLCFHRCLSVHTYGGGGTPSQVRTGRYPIPRSGWWYPISRSGQRGGYHFQGLDGEWGTTIFGKQDPRSGWVVPHYRSGQGDTPGYPLSRSSFRSGWGIGYPGVPPVQVTFHVRMGEGTSNPGQVQGQDGGRSGPRSGQVPTFQDWTEWGPPPLPHQETEQHKEHLLRGRRYASWVHTGGLSCVAFNFDLSLLIYRRTNDIP